MRFAVPSDLSALFLSGLNRSVISLGIKVATAGLTYLTYVVLSRTMAPSQYGAFAIGLSLATVLAVLAGLGQQTAILRLWPQESVAGRAGPAIAAVRAGSALTIAASLLVALGLIGTAFASTLVAVAPDGALHLYAAAALVLPLALAEYQSSALRAQGSVWTALAPRDLLWRIALPLVVFAMAARGIALTGPQALLLAAAILLATLMLQGILAGTQRRTLMPRLAGAGRFWRQHGPMSRWLLFGTLIDTVALNADTLIVGLLLTPEAAATYFNASRTAGLMTLFTYAATLVISPMLARYFHGRDMRKAQAITVVSAWSGFAFSLLAFLAFVLAGQPVLAIFGPAYGDGVWVLLILSAGLLFDAATGSARATMVMTGHERAYAYIAGAATLVGLAAQLVVIPLYGLLGAACVTMAVRIVTQVSVGWWCRARIGLDPTIFGVLRLRGGLAPL